MTFSTSALQETSRPSLLLRLLDRVDPRQTAHTATIHTSDGDIHIRLFPEHAPKAVENFVGHARSGYFEGVVFHRVIPKFMIQTGDPLGDGTGGDSIWGHEFEDEFTSELRHDRCVVNWLLRRVADNPLI